MTPETPAPPVLRPVRFLGTGSYVPERVLTNAELAAMVDTSDEWIVSRTGIRERRLARPDEPTSAMAEAAARRALENAALPAAELDLIVVGTMTPDSACPSVACHLQRLLGAHRAVCFDLSAACSGFLFALETARNFIAAGTFRRALVVAADKVSDLINWSDRNTCVLFGDGAGAAVLGEGDDISRFLSSSLGSEGTAGDGLFVPGGGSAQPVTPENFHLKLGTLHMNGRETYRKAVTYMADYAVRALDAAGLSSADLRCIVPHQANVRIIEAIAERLDLPLDRFFVNLDRYGNTSGAAMAIALDEAWRAGRFHVGDSILLVTFGAGLTFGAAVVRW